MSVSKIEVIIEKLKAICERHKPTINYIFYFPWKNGPEYVCGIHKPSKKFALMAHIIRSKGKLVDGVQRYLAKNADDPMEVVEPTARYLADYQRIYASVQEAITTHCPNCKKGWENKIVADAVGVNPDIETWNDYVLEVNELKSAIEKAQFCIAVEEHFPQDLLEYGSEYSMRAEEIISMFEYLADTTYYFAVEYWEKQDQKMILWSSANGEDLPGTKYLNEEFQNG